MFICNFTFIVSVLACGSKHSVTTFQFPSSQWERDDWEASATGCCVLCTNLSCETYHNRTDEKMVLAPYLVFSSSKVTFDQMKNWEILCGITTVELSLCLSSSLQLESWSCLRFLPAKKLCFSHQQRQVFVQEECWVSLDYYGRSNTTECGIDFFLMLSILR